MTPRAAVDVVAAQHLEDDVLGAHPCGQLAHQPHADLRSETRSAHAHVEPSPPYGRVVDGGQRAASPPAHRQTTFRAGWRRNPGSLPDVAASDSGERRASDEERSPAQPEPGLTAREARQREREARRHEPPQGMVPARERRRSKLERGSMRLIATGGIIGIATILGAVLVGQDVAGWIVGLAVGLTSVLLAALLWSSRQL
jgi:hypothetical protein